VIGTARQVPAYWELASAHGRPVSVVNWWGTWPASPVLGHIVSERVHYFRQAARGAPPEERRLTFPPELHAQILPLVMRPDEVTYEQAQPFLDVSREEFAAMMARPFTGKTIESEFKHLYSMFETDRRVALALVEASRRQFGQPSDLLVLFRIVDIACHSSLRESELVEDHIDATPEDRRRYARVVSEAYRSVDRALGQLLEAFGPANVLVLSDHGFWLEDQGPGKPYMYHHRRAPPGILIAAGPAFRAGEVRGLSVYDVLPLLVALQGLPLADDLEGRVPEAVFAPGFLAASPPPRVATYGRRRALTSGAADLPADEEMIERLRALGYVN
jgi:arylsulfatase A-like enzyme